MASSSSSLSSSSITPKLEYEVFLSFHGPDTRKKITSHLYEAFCQKKIRTFIDDKLIRGEEISPSLLKAIKQSKISVIIFSKRYALSRWCLTELEEIIKCKNNYGQVVIPIFHEVDPSDVRNQTGDFGKAFSELEKRFMDDSEMLQRWRTALRDAANLSGFDSKNHGSEASLVRNIVDDILKRFSYDSTTIQTENLVGLDSSIEEIEYLLCMKGVHNVAIWGIGGIGKTTLAKAIFNKIFRLFEASYFIENIREQSEKSGGLNDVRQKLSQTLLGDLHPNSGFIFPEQRLSRKKVLIVFDDVTTNLKQKEFLTEIFRCLDSESRIIITTRDKRVLTNYGVHHHIHEMKELYFHEALQVFKLHAFKEESPTEDYSELSKGIVECCKGLPLALKVLGDHLCKRTKREWESALKNLKINGCEDIHEVLKISYDGLKHEEKVVFLDIACFFKGYQRDFIEAILNADDFDSHICINVLTERSLLITKSFGTIEIHDLLQEMGRKIVQQESIHNLGKRSRLWNHKDIVKVLKNNEGTRTIRSIHLDMSKVSELPLNPKAFDNMQHLRFLEFYGSKHEKKVHESNSSAWGLISRFWKENSPISRFWKKNSPKGEKKVHGFEVLKSDFSELRYFCWDGYPAKSLPPNFNPKNLVALWMPNSKVKELWTGNQELVNLKHIDLRDSEHLRKMPDFSLMPNLESLILECCTNLLDSFSSIQNLRKLVILNLEGCEGIGNLPISVHCKSLREINLSNCSNLKTVPYLPCTVKELNLHGTAIKELISIEHLSRLKQLNLENCSRLERLPESVRELKSLEYLSLSHCSKLDRWPNNLENLTTLKRLVLTDAKLPTSVINLINLEYLQSLEYLYIDQNNFESLPVSIKYLSELLVLDVSNCKRLKSLPELPPKTCTIEARNCISLESLSILPSSGFDWEVVLRKFKCYNCSKLQLDMEKESLKMETAIHQMQHLDTCVKYTHVSIFYPGSDIPNWFTIQSTDDFIEFPLNYKPIGFVFCVVPSLQDCQGFAFIHAGYSFFLGGEVVFNGFCSMEKGVIQSDHVLLRFDFTLYNWRGLDLNSKGCIELQLYGSDGVNDRIFLKVKKYGVRLLYDK